MIRDPLAEVLEVALRTPDDAGPDDLDPGDVAALHLARRRFGVALPPPYATRPSDPSRLPVRPAGAADGPALAAIQRRAWRAGCRGLVPDAALEEVDLHLLGRRWAASVAAARSPGHHVLVAGRPAEAHGMIEVSPAPADEDAAGGGVSEVRRVHVDPTVMGQGLGTVLLEAAVEALRRDGVTGVVAWVAEGHLGTRSLYERWGWELDGTRKVTPACSAGPPMVEELDEVRYRLALRSRRW